MDSIIHVLNNWGQAVTYKNDKKLCCLNNDRNNNKYELNDVNDKNNIIIIFAVIIISIVIIILIIVIVIIIYFYSSNLIFSNTLHLQICWFATPKLLRNNFFWLHLNEILSCSLFSIIQTKCKFSVTSHNYLHIACKSLNWKKIIINNNLLFQECTLDVRW